jgi:leucyl-tRNA synthetase
MTDVYQDAFRTLLLLLAPFAPHLAEHMWEKRGEAESVHTATWPVPDSAHLLCEDMTIVVQIAGKKRSEFSVPVETTEQEIQDKALKDETVQKFLGDTKPTRVIYVPGRLINIVP